ncbi:hypothetical protein BDK51DRAFT_33360 [Blyttiomyces helicus]|uniref:Uncharacterized protein n=1 Tax=Blyttiomyces helicus TaxID=388810 RepID=A0A4P9WR04_9FUNG|nr:hypothetical protein BDK51DRAFT_33360 [Blyttiomyces helicus]|eukprot:RKO94268.1 hypothetical protein BDK51DRAFT_33360 [Blyttiomyces helicus]
MSKALGEFESQLKNLEAIFGFTKEQILFETQLHYGSQCSPSKATPWSMPKGCDSPGTFSISTAGSLEASLRAEGPVDTPAAGPLTTLRLSRDGNHRTAILALFELLRTIYLTARPSKLYATISNRQTNPQEVANTKLGRIVKRNCRTSRAPTEEEREDYWMQTKNIPRFNTAVDAVQRWISTSPEDRLVRMAKYRVWKRTNPEHYQVWRIMYSHAHFRS